MLRFMVFGLLTARIALAAPEVITLATPVAGTAIPEGVKLSRRVEFAREERVRNVSQPTLQVFLPPAGTATGTGVVVAPGGSFMMLSIQSEGDQVAQWLNEHGIAAFVLTYRLNATLEDPQDFEKQLVAVMTDPHPWPMRIDDTPGARYAKADGLEALRYVREHAAAYGLTPGRIGIIGFSAGGIVASHAATRYDAASRPDFAGVIYGALSEGTPVPADAPPVFLAVAADDPLLANASEPIFHAWREHGRVAELHVYSHGGHGFGMNLNGHSSDHFMEEFYGWLQAEGFTTR